MKEVLAEVGKLLCLEKSNVDAYHGVYNGFEFNVFYLRGAPYPFRVLISSHISRDIGPSIFDKLSFINQNGKRFNITEAGVSLYLSKGYAKSPRIESLPSLFDHILQHLTLLGLPGKDYCPFSGDLMTEENSKVFSTGPVKIRMTYASAERLNNDLDSSVNEFKNRPANDAKGFGGALLAILGATILEIVLTYVGFISGFSILIAMFGGMRLFTRFGGKPSYHIIISIAVASLLMLGGSLVGLYLNTALTSYEGGTPMDSLKTAFADNRFALSFFIDIGFLFGLLVVNTVVLMLSLRKRLQVPERLS